MDSEQRDTLVNPIVNADMWRFVWEWAAAVNDGGQSLPHGPMCLHCTAEFNLYGLKGIGLMNQGASYFLERVRVAAIAHEGCTSGVGSGDIGWHDL